MKLFELRRMVLVAYVLLWPPFLILALRKSHQADVLGLWSYRVFWCLLVYLAILAPSTILAWRLQKQQSPELSWLVRMLEIIRQSRLLTLLAAAVPLLAWIVVVGYVGMIRIEPSWPLLASLFDLGLLVLVFEATLGLSEKPTGIQRELVKKIAVAFAGFFVAVVTVEIAGAVFGLGKFAGWQTNAKNVDARFRTNDFDVQVVTNGQGLREAHEIKPRHSGKFRIVVVGDSMTFGWGVDAQDAYPKQTESLLTNKYGLPVEVVNLGKPGANPSEYLKFIRQYVPQLEPDLIVLGFLIGNDCPVVPPARLRDPPDADQLVASYVAASRRDPVRRQLWKSTLVRLFDVGFYQRLGQFQSVGTTGKPGPVFGEPNPLDPRLLQNEIRHLDDPDGGRKRFQQLQQTGWIAKGLNWDINPWLLRSVILNPAGAADALGVRRETSTAMKSEWMVCERLLRAMKSAAAEYDTKIVVLAIPIAQTVSPEWVRFLGQLGCEVSADMTASHLINDWLQQFCLRNGLECVDPLSRFRSEQSAGRELYFKTDDHMTPTGHRVLAEELAVALFRRLGDSISIQK